MSFQSTSFAGSSMRSSSIAARVEVASYSREAIQNADRGVWAEKQMAAYFPGNIQMYSQGADVLFSEGSLGAALAGMQFTFGARVGTAGGLHRVGKAGALPPRRNIKPGSASFCSKVGERALPGATDK